MAQKWVEDIPDHGFLECSVKRFPRHIILIVKTRVTEHSVHKTQEDGYNLTHRLNVTSAKYNFYCHLPSTTFTEEDKIQTPWDSQFRNRSVGMGSVLRGYHAET